MPRRLTLSFAIAIALAAPAIAGADENIERTRICHPGFARAGRPSAAAWTRLKAEAMSRAGLPWSERNDFEFDHIVPRCLDGSNDLSNLQLQPWPEAEEKDHREAETCRTYCDGEISLEQARSSFHREWP
jgi:hypothetical protein